MNFTQVMTKANKRRASSPTEFAVNITDGVITIARVDPKTMAIIKQSQPFRVGDKAEYDSYNLSYIGTITKITPNTVTIVEPYGQNARVHRLSMYQFCWRNYDFDLIKKHDENSKTMMYI